MCNWVMNLDDPCPEGYGGHLQVSAALVSSTKAGEGKENLMKSEKDRSLVFRIVWFLLSNNHKPLETKHLGE